MSKILVVFGATGIQGGSVVKAILADPVLSRDFKIKAVTRDPSKDSAKALAQQGVEVVKADLDSKDSLRDALKNAHTVFLVTDFFGLLRNPNPTLMGEGKNLMDVAKEREILHGKNAADVAKEMEVQHLIFSSYAYISKVSKGKYVNVRQVDSKGEVEEYIRGIGVPATFLHGGTYMSNFFRGVGLSFQKKPDGTYKLPLPAPANASRFPLIKPTDTGNYVKAIIKHREQLLGERFFAASGYYTAQEIVDEFAEIKGKEVEYSEITQDEFISTLPPFLQQQMLETFLIMADPDVGLFPGYPDLKPFHEMLDEQPISWKKYVATDATYKDF
ncbi:NAD(P)-binding protein [Ascobolus immersus RN42]|uniref:NAD(P)-binding protein n=1 Tax=Ascobolus immersus RN42 TaxID=1160509 RepID=A0A3N4IAY8_ASCIM|nr:NAD(P)-binding protein [Ascobolus immersus RN42]